MKEEIERTLAKFVDREISYQEAVEELNLKAKTGIAIGLVIGAILGTIAAW